MAKIKQGILGGFSGKVAGVVGTSWKGRAVMKSRPLSVSNPKTEAQVSQRGKFSDIAALASEILTTFVQPVENPISGDISGYNLFVKDNKQAFDEAHQIVMAKFVSGGGKLLNLESAEITGSLADEEVILSWTNSAGISALRKTDKVYAAVVTLKGELVAVTSGTSTRNDGTVTIKFVREFDDLQQGDYIYCIYAVVSADGRDVSVLTSSIVTELGI